MPSLKEDVAVLKEQIKEIKENHLVHLAQDIGAVSEKQDKLVWLVLSTLLVGLLGAAISVWK